MIDPTRETPIPLSKVPKLPWLRDLHRRLHVATIYRWASRGLRGHRLESLQLGGTRVTSEAALLRFFESLTENNVNNRPHTHRRHEELDRIDRQLDAAGL